MTAPRVLSTGTKVRILPPADFSLDELADAVREWEAAQKDRDDLWANRQGSGPDMQVPDDLVQSRADDVMALLTWEMSVVKAIGFAAEVHDKAGQAVRRAGLGVAS